MFDYDKPSSRPSTVTPFDLSGDILAHTLTNSVFAAFKAFVEGKCLAAFGAHPFRLRLVRVINGYVAGIASGKERIDYFREPKNLYVACSILASNDWAGDVNSRPKWETGLMMKDVNRKKGNISDGIGVGGGEKVLLSHPFRAQLRCSGPDGIIETISRIDAVALADADILE
ncbi:hypothetical protein DFS33DRAFT_1449138 [Desarmillaria ectypa]|nr:hypothetical protein DFS33DRAFT_1449138 [Desarmillaria ectypa]